MKHITLHNPTLEKLQVNLFGHNHIEPALEHLKDGDFSQVGSWITDVHGNAAIAISGGELSIDIDPLFPPVPTYYGVTIYQNLAIPLEKGKKYTFSYTVTTAATGSLRLGFSKQANLRSKIYISGSTITESWLGEYFDSHLLSNEAGMHTFEFIPNDTYDRFTLEASGSSLILMEAPYKGAIDDVSLKETVPENFARADTLQPINDSGTDNLATFKRAAVTPSLVNNLKLICNTKEQLFEPITYKNNSNNQRVEEVINPMSYTSVRNKLNIIDIPFKDKEVMLSGDSFFEVNILPKETMQLNFQ